MLVKYIVLNVTSQYTDAELGEDEDKDSDNCMYYRLCITYYDGGNVDVTPGKVAADFEFILPYAFSFWYNFLFGFYNKYRVIK